AHRNRREVRCNAAELLVIDRFGYRRRIATDWTLWIAPEIEFAKFHFQGVEIEKPAEERFAHAQNQFDRFVCLNRSNDSWKHAEHTCLRAIRNRAWRQIGRASCRERDVM